IYCVKYFFRKGTMRSHRKARGISRIGDLGCGIFTLVVLLETCAQVRSSVMGGVAGNGYQTDSCRKEVKQDCMNLTQEKSWGPNTCFGVMLPYTETSNELVNANFTLKQIRSEMTRWEEGLKSLPRCWAVVQPLLCSFFMPKCHEKKIDLPSQELCKISRNPCRVIEESLKEWPAFLRCDDLDKFAPNCKNSEVRELRFNTSAKCNYPMIAVESSFNHYDGFEGCALPCKDNCFTDGDHETVSTFIKYFGMITMFANGVVIVTFMIDWHSSSGYPSIIVFYVNCCYFIATIGWMVQFLPNAKEDIVCRRDGTIRRFEPSSGENAFCFIVYLIIYYFSMAAMLWSVVFAYVWNLTCNAVGRIRERVDKQSIVFHFVCWLSPLVFLAFSTSWGAVGGNSLTGICYDESTKKIVFTILPVGLAAFVMAIFLIRGVSRLVSVLVSSSDFISSRGRSEVKSNAVRVGAFTASAIALASFFAYTQYQDMNMKPIWAKTRRDQLVCNLNLTIVAECDTGAKPSASFAMTTISAFFIGGILVSSWAWTGASYRTWRRFLIRRCCCRRSDRSLDQQQHAVAKHKLISQAFAKRHQLNLKGRLSLSLHSTHEDPVGLNKMLDPNHLCQEIDTEMQTHNNTDAREEISSEWAAAIPSLCNRRDAIIPPHSSNSVSCVSADDSRRPSCDSAMSENVGRHGTPYEDKKSRRRFFHMGRRRSGRLWGSGWRRGNGGSSSSLESNAGSQILPAITALIDKRRRIEEDVPLNNAPLTGPTTRRPIIMKELAVQTSMEKLNFPKNVKSCNLSNNLTADIATQCGRSLLNLNDAGTQTKKSATKKGEKSKKDKNHSKTDKEKGKDDKNDKDEQEDPVLKLLTPS
ncbi:unnamed protein product, partial [Allacma fusca]